LIELSFKVLCSCGQHGVVGGSHDVDAAEAICLLAGVYNTLLAHSKVCPERIDETQVEPSGFAETEMHAPPARAVPAEPGRVQRRVKTQSKRKGGRG